MLTGKQVERFMTDAGANSSNSSNSFHGPQKLTLDPVALYGLPGRLVRTIDPYTEADPVAVLTNILIAFGNVVGPSPHVRVEETRHGINLFVVQVGETAKGRKGTAWSTPRRVFSEVDKDWAENQVTAGLSSGQGLIYAVRDPRSESKPVKEDGEVVGFEDVLVDQGVEDKRLLLIEQEFSRVLKVMMGEQNILSTVIRDAWDHGNLRTIVKNDPNRATGAHISIITHITKAELLRYLTETEQANGFANRFLWVVVARSKCISRPIGVPAEILMCLVEQLRDAVIFARNVGEIQRDDQAAKEWDAIYPELSDGKPGMFGAIIGRAEVQVLRLSCLYALLDRSAIVRAEHQQAALALWEYCEQSVQAIFGDATGDTNIDRAKEALKVRGAMTLTELHGLFGRNADAKEVSRIITTLEKMGVAKQEPATDERGRKSITKLCWVTNSTNSTNSTTSNS